MKINKHISFPKNYNERRMVFLVKQQSWRSILEKRLLLFRTIFWHCCPKWECKSSSLISYCLIHHFSSSSPLLNKSAILMFWSSSCFWIIHTRELLRHNNHPLLARRSSPSSECPTLSRVIRHVKTPQEFTILTQTCVSFKLLKCIEDELKRLDSIEHYILDSFLCFTSNGSVLMNHFSIYCGHL